MKILFITHNYYPFIGGIEENIKNISSFLKERHNVNILTLQMPELNTIEMIDGKKVFRKKMISFFTFPYNSYDVIFIENFNILPHLFFEIKIIFLNFTNKKPKKIIFVPHGGFTPYWKSFKGLQREFKKAYHRVFGKFFINSYVNSIIAVSDWEKNELIKSKILLPIHTIRNGVMGPIMHLTSIKKNYFLYVGRIDPIKNIEAIISVFALLKKDNKFDDYSLKIIGDYKSNYVYYLKLTTLINRYRISDSVDFMGKIIGANKDVLIRQSKCLFCLSKYESDSIVIKEAFSAGTKVRINSNAALKDYLYENNVYSLTDNEINIDSFSEFLDEQFDPNIKIPLLTWEQVAIEYEKIFL